MQTLRRLRQAAISELELSCCGLGWNCKLHRGHTLSVRILETAVDHRFAVWEN